MSSAEVKQSLE